jgi:hypothetical protein
VTYFHDSDPPDLVVRLRRWADIYAHVNVSDELLEAAGEIERLRRWKAEASTVLGYWDDAYERSGVQGLLGDSKPKLMADEIIRLRDALTEAVPPDPDPADVQPWVAPLRSALADNKIRGVGAVVEGQALVQLTLEMETGHTLTVTAVDDAEAGEALSWELVYPQPIQIGGFDWVYPSPFPVGPSADAKMPT